MANSPENFLEERREEMVSPTGGEPTPRVAHFLTPSVTSIDRALFDLPSNTYFPGPESNFDHSFKKSNLKMNFQWWRNPQKDWNRWVEQMSSLHPATWKKAGIFEAIRNSTYSITRNEDLILRFAEKWCPDTNTFIFPWGEATITLEDMMILGGYSVLGHPVFRPVDSDELAVLERKLLLARSELAKTKSKKPSQSLWLTKFMDSGNEIEHEAFLALWLSRFVFPNKCTDATVQKDVIAIAVHLASGTKIALAPAILANLYASLSELKGALVDSRRMQNFNKILELSISTPFQLVQIWVWERFPTLQPKPVTLEHGQTRFAKWNGFMMEKSVDVELAIDEAADYFLWRPYAIGCKSFLPQMIYKEKEQWAFIGSDMDDKDLEALVRCLRVSELVGIDSSCIRQYLPHRVAMQFGFDQDIPGHVARLNLNQNIAWENYAREVRDEWLYIPARLFEPDVTTRYLVWRKSMSPEHCDTKTFVTGWKYEGLLKSHLKEFGCDALASRSLCREYNTVRASGSEKNKDIAEKVSPMSSEKKLLNSAKNKLDNVPIVPPGFFPKTSTAGTSNSGDKEVMVHTKRLRSGTDGNDKAQKKVRLTGAEYKKAIADRVKSSGKRELLNSDEKPTPGFPPKHDTVGTMDSEDKDEQIRFKRPRNETDGKDKTINIVTLTGSQYRKAFEDLVSSRSVRKPMFLNSVGKKSDKDGPVSTGFRLKPNTVRTKDSVDKHEYFQGKNLMNDADGKERSEKGSQLQSPLSSIGESITVQNMQFEPSENKGENVKEERLKTLQGHGTKSRTGLCLTDTFIQHRTKHKCEGAEAQPFCQPPLGPSLPITLEEGNGAEAVTHQKLRIDRGNGKSCSLGALEDPARKLEARIQNLGRILAGCGGGI